MKCWYVLVLLVGVAIGWWILGKYQVKKTVPAVVVTSQIEKVTGKLPTQMTYDIKSQNVQTIDVNGVVQKWGSDTGYVGIFVRNVRE